MVCNFGVIGQPRDVEFEIGNVGKTIPRPTILHKSLDSGEELRERIRYAYECPMLREGNWCFLIASRKEESKIVDESRLVSFLFEGVVQLDI